MNSGDLGNGLLGYRSEENLALSVGLLSKDERLASADNLAATNLAGGALELEGNLLGGLGLTPEDGLGLTSETLLLTIVPIQGIIDKNDLFLDNLF